MWPNPQFPADSVTFTEEIINGKLHFLYSGCRLKARYFLVSFSKILRYFYRTPPWGCFCFIWDSLTLIFLANVSLLYVARYIFPWSGRFHRNTIFHPMPVVWFITSSVKIEIIRYSPIIPKPLSFSI